MFNEIDQLAVNTLRFLSIEAVAEAIRVTQVCLLVPHR